MSITVVRRSASKQQRLLKEQGWTIIDVTSKGEEPWCRFSPFWPHRNIPIPGNPGQTAASVEGVWQGLKVFEHEDVDTSKFSIDTMKNLKRPANRKGSGAVKGHQFEGRIIDYVSARRRIYLPSYLWILDNCLVQEIEELRLLLSQGPVALLDYEINADVSAVSKPLSHASLIANYLSD